MGDIIQLLPDSVANQIAAGEVIQRPASVVKELVENALDAGASEIIVHIKDAGRTLIQVSDNGCGMSATDARMAFERHATSKINSANDLFAIRTMGFRGEALASIAAIAEVEIKTKKGEDEVGTYIHINGSKVLAQEPTGCNNGTLFRIKNLFFNVPARRKFLKKDSTELKHIINEIQRIALPNPHVAISLFHNNLSLYELPKANHYKRIINVFGKSMIQSLVPIDTKTSVVKITGFAGQPKFARRTYGEQFFFVNNRYMRHPYFHKAVSSAYDKLLAPDMVPSYFIFLDVNPANIDINIHPTKTEIKFEDDRAIWQLLLAAIRESLGKHNVVPSIDFDQQGSVDIPMAPRQGDEVEVPQIEVDFTYNPFEEKRPASSENSSFGSGVAKSNLNNWEKLYEGFENENAHSEQPQEDARGELYDTSDISFSGKKLIQIKNKYILTPVKSGIMLIDQKRAQERVLYEKFMEVLVSESVASQQQLFPQTIELNPADASLLMDINEDLSKLGFDIREFGKNTFVINGTPGMLGNVTPEIIVEKLLEEYKNSPSNAKEKVKEQIAMSLAKASAVSHGVELKPEEMSYLIDNLFACATPNYSPDGKPVLSIISLDEIEKSFFR